MNVPPCELFSQIWTLLKHDHVMAMSFRAVSTGFIDSLRRIEEYPIDVLKVNWKVDVDGQLEMMESFLKCCNRAERSLKSTNAKPGQSLNALHPPVCGSTYISDCCCLAISWVSGSAVRD